MATTQADMSDLMNIPYEMPTKGQTSNFTDPESRGPAIVIVSYISIAIMWPIFLLRFYCKALVIRKIGWDDLSFLLAAIGGTAFAAEIIWSVAEHIAGPHAWDVRAINFMKLSVIKVISTEAVVYSLTILFAKLALLHLYHHLFAVNPKIRIAIYLGAGLNAIFYVTSAIVLLVYCVPRPGESYQSAQFAKRCKSPTQVGLAQGIFGLISDLYIYVLPLPVLWRLQMAFRKKLGITAIFLTGSIAIVASSLGLYYRVLESVGTDFTWVQCPAAGLAVVEVAVGVICGSVPHFPRLFRHHAFQVSRITRLVDGILSVRRYKPRRSPDLPLNAENPTKPKRGTAEDPRLDTQVLGSIQGQGRFIEANHIAAGWENQPLTISQTCDAMNNGPNRAHFEYSGSTASRDTSDKVSHPTKQDSQASENPISEKNSLAAESTTSRKGYWDVMSIFRSGNAKSSALSGSNPKSQPSHV